MSTSPSTPPPIPTTLDEAVDQLIADMSPEDRRQFCSRVGGNVSFLGGMGLRNAWGLWHGTTGISRYLRDHGVYHGDDQGQTIANAVYAKLMGLPFDVDERGRHYADWWRDQYGTLWDGSPIPGAKGRMDENGGSMVIAVNLEDGSITFPARPILPL